MAPGRSTALRFANRVIAALEEPFDLGGVTAQIGGSIGIALFPDDASEAETLIQRADMAMYRAKASTATAYAFFDPAIDAALRERAELEADLRHAVGTSAIVPYYQPLVDLAHGSTFGFEVLARWNHPTRGLLEPDAFIPLAEDLRLIGELCSIFCAGRSRMPPTGTRTWFCRSTWRRISSRIGYLTEKIFAVLEAAEFPPSRLEVELTETALVTDIEAAKEAIDAAQARRRARRHRRFRQGLFQPLLSCANCPSTWSRSTRASSARTAATRRAPRSLRRSSALARPWG